MAGFHLGGWEGIRPPLLDVCPPLEILLYILYCTACSTCPPWYAKTAILPPLEQNPKCCPVWYPVIGGSISFLVPNDASFFFHRCVMVVLLVASMAPPPSPSPNYAAATCWAAPTCSSEPSSTRTPRHSRTRRG